MPKIRNLNHQLLFLLFSFVATATQAVEPSAVADHENLYEIADVSVSLPDTIAKSNSFSPTVGDRLGPSLPDNIGLFSLPLLGTFEGFGFRVASADGGPFDSLTQQAIFADFALPWRWTTRNNISITPRLTVEAGRFESGSEHRFFASFGPSIRLASNTGRAPLSVDLGISPTVIDGSHYRDNDFGTSFALTSYAALNIRFGQTQNKVVKLRYQHISNARFHNNNPGINMLGIDFSFSAR